MPEYIDRGRLVETLTDIVEDFKDEHSFTTDFAATIISDILSDVIKAFPSADVAPVRHGRWEHDHYENCSDNFEIVKCSRCGHQAYAIAFYVKSGNYCPNCGVKMDGGAD